MPTATRTLPTAARARAGARFAGLTLASTLLTRRRAAMERRAQAELALQEQERNALRAQRVRAGAGLLAASGAGALLSYLWDPANGRRRRHLLRDRTLARGRRGARRTVRQAEYTAGHARGIAHRAHLVVTRPQREYDDVTLARKVETVIFRPADAPKGSVDVSAHDGVVELRGQLDREEQIAALVRAAARVDGVAHVRSLLHTPPAA